MSDRDGLLLVDKAGGITSHDAVQIARRRTRIKKIGHSGTLDPLATGLLILCVGKATRLQAYLMEMEKVYEGTIQFGWATDSYDATGVPVGEKTPAEVGRERVAKEARSFLGVIDQIPPRFSAKKIEGVRAYELARRGEMPVMTAKRVTISEFEIMAVTGSTAAFRVRCSAGTYVRSLAHDLGVKLGVGAHLLSLSREAIGGFHRSDAIGSEALDRATSEQVFASPHFQTLREAELPLVNVLIDRMQEEKLVRGEVVIVKPESPIKESELVSVRNPDGELVAIAEVAQVLREGGPVALQPKVVLRGQGAEEPRGRGAK